MKKIGRPLSTVVYAIYKGDTFIDVGTKSEREVWEAFAQENQVNLSTMIRGTVNGYIRFLVHKVKEEAQNGRND